MVVFGSGCTSYSFTSLLRLVRNPLKSLYASQHSYVFQVTSELVGLLSKKQPIALLQERLEELRIANDQHHEEMNRIVHTHGQAFFSDQSTLSTELNVNREIHHWCKALLSAVQELFASSDGVSDIEKLIS